MGSDGEEEVGRGGNDTEEVCRREDQGPDGGKEQETKPRLGNAKDSRSFLSILKSGGFGSYERKRDLN